MRRLTVRLRPDQMTYLRREAERRRTSVSAIVREAIERLPEPPESDVAATSRDEARSDDQDTGSAIST